MKKRFDFMKEVQYEYFIYPIYIYLYAIDLYSANLDKGQRWAAAETRKYFGLATFAHTTLGRALKAFVRHIEEENADEDAFVDAVAETASSVLGKPVGFPTVQATAPHRERVARFLQGRLVGAAGPQQAAAVGCELARECFEKHRRFLL